MGVVREKEIRSGEELEHVERVQLGHAPPDYDSEQCSQALAMEEVPQEWQVFRSLLAVCAGDAPKSLQKLGPGPAGRIHHVILIFFGQVLAKKTPEIISVHDVWEP